MSLENKIKLNFSIEVCLISFTLIIPMIGYLNSLFRGFITSWGLIILYIVYLGAFKKKFLLQKGSFRKDFVFLITFVLIVFINFLLVDLNSKSQQYFLIFFFFLVLYILDVLLERDIRKKTTIIYLIFISLGVQAVVSIPYILSSDFMLIRNLSSGQLSEELAKEAIKNGVGTNALYTSLASLSLFGLIFQKYIQNVFARGTLLLSVSVMIFTIFISTFFAAILMFIVGLILLLFLSFGNFLSLKNILIGVLVFFISNFMFEEYLSETRLLDPVTKKVESFLEQGGDVTGRDKLARVSLETFYDNPFFGIGVSDWRSYDKVGEHMPWVDFLANFGFIGLLPLILFLFFRIRNRFNNCSIKHPLNAICLIGACVFILSNFISPMITTPITYISLIFIYTSNSFKRQI